MKSTAATKEMDTFLHTKDSILSQVLDEAVDNSKHITPDNKHVQAAYKHYIYINPEVDLTIEAFAKIKRQATITAAMEAYRRANDIPSMEEDVREMEEMSAQNMKELKKLYDKGLLKREVAPRFETETDDESRVEVVFIRQNQKSKRI